MYKTHACVSVVGYLFGDPKLELTNEKSVLKFTIITKPYIKISGVWQIIENYYHAVIFSKYLIDKIYGDLKKGVYVFIAGDLKIKESHPDYNYAQINEIHVTKAFVLSDETKTKLDFVKEEILLQIEKNLRFFIEEKVKDILSESKKQD